MLRLRKQFRGILFPYAILYAMKRQNHHFRLYLHVLMINITSQDQIISIVNIVYIVAFVIFIVYLRVYKVSFVYLLVKGNVYDDIIL